MRIIDAQVHIWSSGKPNPAHRAVTSFTAEELLSAMAAAGVDSAVLHPPAFDPGSHAMAIEAVQRHRGRFCILGSFPLDRPESRALVDDWTKQPGMVGLRFPLTYPNQVDWPHDGTLDWLWPAAERAGVPIAMMAGRFLPKFAVIAERHPRLRLIIDHFGLVRGARDEAAFASLPALLKLARLPNVAIKATGAPAYSTALYPFRTIHDGLHRIFDAFGPSRFFWGTDITRMTCSYRQCVTMFTEELPWLHGADLAAVMGAGLCDWLGYRWPD